MNSWDKIKNWFKNQGHIQCDGSIMYSTHLQKKVTLMSDNSHKELNGICEICHTLGVDKLIEEVKNLREQVKYNHSLINQL